MRAGDKLQPLDVRKGSRDATLHQNTVRPSPYRSEGAMTPFTGDLAQTGTLQQALEVGPRLRHVNLTPAQSGPWLVTLCKAARRTAVPWQCVLPGMLLQGRTELGGFDLPALCIPDAGKVCDMCVTHDEGS